MKRVTLLPALVATVLAVGCEGSDLMGPTESEALARSDLLVAAGTDQPGMTNQPAACWGQASAVFAMTGEMGMHSSEHEEPRLGLANLARALFDMGVISEPTLAALGVFVADQERLSIDACM